MGQQTILIDVGDEGEVSVYLHDPKNLLLVGRVQTEVSVIYGHERRVAQELSLHEVQDLINGHDEMIEHSKKIF